VSSYVFAADVAEEDDGRWSAWIEALPGCATWGYSREEALVALQEAAQAYIEVLLEQGQPLPQGVSVQAPKRPRVADRPRIAVTV
jgi:predicted RNase H-like HicB family nuclease